VRIKSGLYFGDLGLVENTAADNKVWLRLIPRLDMNPKKAQTAIARFNT
jgi:transcription elongation factor SPT5